MVANLRQMLEDATEREFLEALFQRLLVIYFMTVWDFKTSVHGIIENFAKLKDSSGRKENFPKVQDSSQIKEQLLFLGKC